MHSFFVSCTTLKGSLQDCQNLAKFSNFKILFRFCVESRSLWIDDEKDLA